MQILRRQESESEKYEYKNFKTLVQLDITSQKWIRQGFWYLNSS